MLVFKMNIIPIVVTYIMNRNIFLDIISITATIFGTFTIIISISLLDYIVCFIILIVVVVFVAFVACCVRVNVSVSQHV